MQFLSESHRHRIHQVGPAGLDDFGQFIRATIDGIAQMHQCRQQLLGNGQAGTDLDGGGNNVIGALAHVYVIIGMDPDSSARSVDQVGNDLVGVHVGTGAGTGLKHIHWKVFIELADRDPAGRLDDGLGLAPPQ